MRPEIRRLTTEQFVSLLGSVYAQLTRRLTGVHLHHTWRPTRAQFRGAATIEAMRQYHLGLGWDDIAQHLTIDPGGMSWTGRNWNLPPASQKGQNGSTAAGPFMIEIVGDFDQGQDQLDGDQRTAVCHVVAGILRQAGLYTSDIHFHRDLGSPKTCPGSGVDKAALLQDVAAVLAGPRAVATRGRKSAKRAAREPETAPVVLPLPLEYLVSRDVALPVPAPVEGAADHEVSEDGASGRAFAREAEARARVYQSTEVAHALEREANRWPELRPYVVNLSRGKLSRDGAFTMDDESITDIIDSIRQYASTTHTPRVMLHAHGGLISERAALEYAKAAHEWWLEHGVYPIYFVWETHAFEILKGRLPLGRGFGDLVDGVFERMARPIGRPLWRDMKDYALKSSAVDAGGGEPGGARVFAQALRGLLARPPAGRPITLHAVGHSAGANFHCHFLPMLLRQAMSVETAAFLAPAVRIDLFKQMLAPELSAGRIRRFDMFTMDEEAERDDDCLEVAGVPVYGKSLLYLVSNAFEPEDAAPILGLEERYRTDADVMGLFQPLGVHHLERSHAAGKPHNPRTHARRHGCFDSDDATMKSVLETVTGSRTTVPFPVVDGGCDAAASRAAGFGAANRGWSVRADPCAGTGAVGRRRALCVGIDRYPTSPLAGCVKDAQAWAAALGQLDFTVKTLFDAEATRAGVLAALEQLVTTASPGDSLVFQYAGHGTQAEDLNGDEHDRFDEALMPIDFATGALLLDDDLAGVYRRLPAGAVLTLFMDCCHSGTNSRFAPFDRSPARGDERRRFFELTPELAEAHRRFRAGVRDAVPTHPDESLPGVIHFAACLDSEFAYESGGQGHFTRVAAAALTAAVFGGRTNEQFGGEVAAEVIRIGRPQTPRMMRLPVGLEGRPLLGGGARSPTTLATSPGTGLSIDDRTMAEWCLQFFEAGAAHWRQRLGH